MFKVDSAGIRKQLKWSCWSVHTHTHTQKSTRTSVPALLTWQHSWYFIKIKYSEPNISAPASVSPLERDWSTKPIIYIINNSLAFRYVTLQIWKYSGIFGFVLHCHVRDAFRISTLFSSVQLMAFAVLLLAVIKQRCITAGAPFWIGGELPVFVVNTCTVPPLIQWGFFKFSHLQRMERSVIFIVGTPQLWETESKKNPENHIVWFLNN